MCLLLLSRTTLQSLYQATENARQNNYYVGGLSHTWMTFYQSQLTEDYLIRNEWYIYIHVHESCVTPAVCMLVVYMSVCHLCVYMLVLCT